MQPHLPTCCTHQAISQLPVEISFRLLLSRKEELHFYVIQQQNETDYEAKCSSSLKELQSKKQT